jgi:murein L,D-transpeptidase YcbB/YkuD
MNKIVVCLIALIAGAAALAPAAAQEAAAGLAGGPVIIAPAQSELGQIIKTGLSSAYYGAAKDSTAYGEAQKLYFFYGGRHFEPIWVEQSPSGTVSFSASAQKIMALFESAASEGLRPSDYLTPDLNLAGVTPSANAMATLETAFSRATLRYASHIYNGRIKPQSVSDQLDITPKKLDTAALLIELATSPDPVAVLARLEPVHPEFQALKRALASFDETSAAERPPQVQAGPTLKPGMYDARVHTLRARFNLGAAQSDLYDDQLVGAMKAFQRQHGLDVDGVMGPATLTTLNGGAPVTRADIIANMERWRWMPRDLGAFHVLVNIPEYRLAISNNGVEQFTTRVVVGTVKNQTPVFSDNIRHLVVNPYWNVPNSIVKGEIGPKTRANPGYVDAQNMDLLYNGEVVSPWQVNWQAVGDGFPFRVRQRPGPGNALGQIKFLFPNKHDVYLHDTPSKGLFGRSARALSHGCVRVEDPMAFADALMANEPNISRSSLEAMYGPSERWVNPTKQIPVHLAYFTLRVGADGTLQSYGDIYGHNANLIAALGLGQPGAVSPQITASADPASNELAP